MKNKNLKYILLSLVLLFAACEDKSDAPGISSDDALAKKEMRAVWFTTAWGLDWPQSDYNATSQKQKFKDYLDKFVDHNINTVIVQIRPMADAFYNSSYEPWSSVITGTKGQDPGYDVLQFMIDETHARGLEFHAWMNPYRIATRASATTPFPALDPKIPASMVMEYEVIQFYNPALPQVQDRIADIVKDVITKYDVDGIHFDDYFYPAPGDGKKLNDAADYTTYGEGYATVEDFRRGNVNKAIEKVHQVIVANKPGVLFTISPAPDQSYNYGSLYADVTLWCKNGWVDIVMPQLYSSTTNATANFVSRGYWWDQNCYKATPMAGIALYKFGNDTDAAFGKTSELQAQFSRIRATSSYKGYALYAASEFNTNRIEILTTLKELNPDPAVVPFIGRKTEADPTPASNVNVTGTKLAWTVGANLRSVVYKMENGKGRVVTVTKGNNYTLADKGDYCVTTLNGDNTESAVSSTVTYK